MLRPALVDDRPSWLGLSARASAVMAAAVAVCLQLPVAITTGTTGVAVASVASALVSGRRRGHADAVLTATGGTLVVMMLTGLSLALAGLPLTAQTWAVSLATISLAGLTWAHRRATDHTMSWGRRPGERRAAVVLCAWLVVAGLIGTAALVISLRVTALASRAPLEMSLTRTGTGGAAVAISTARATGPLDLRVSAASGRSHGYRVPGLTAGGSIQIPVRIPVAGRTVISLSDPGQSQPLRTVVVSGQPNEGNRTG